MAKRIQVGGRIESKEVGGIVTGAAEILDDAKGKKQSTINGETDDELLRLDQSKQDNLTFDNAPTEGSDNPVKSGGLYTAQQAILLAIAAINELIPSAASALNQLADKAFVNSSISTNTATFRGTSAAGLNEQQFLAWANGLEHDLNDYVFWQTSDAAGNTLFKRYKWNGTEWAYEYTLNNSTFTAEQWEAIQSGITALLVTKLRALPTAQELIQSFDSKQDVLTFDDVPTLGSTNPVKSSGIYNVIKAITDLIPAEATAQNQLADKADVAAKIVAAIPSWKGQYDALTDLQAVTGAKAGDMGCVKTTDSDGHAVLTFYQYSAQGAWVVYYTLRHYAQNKPATTGTTGDYPYNGMGRVELQKNIVNGVNTLSQAMLTQQNTIYVIQYDFTLGEDITVPENCVLEFDGGSVSGGYTITGQNTKYIGTIAKDNILCKLSGTFINNNGNILDNDYKLFKKHNTIVTISLSGNNDLTESTLPSFIDACKRNYVKGLVVCLDIDIVWNGSDFVSWSLNSFIGKTSYSDIVNLLKTIDIPIYALKLHSRICWLKNQSESYINIYEPAVTDIINGLHSAGLSEITDKIFICNENYLLYSDVSGIPSNKAAIERLLLLIKTLGYRSGIAGYGTWTLKTGIANLDIVDKHDYPAITASSIGYKGENLVIPKLDFSDVYEMQGQDIEINILETGVSGHSIALRYPAETNFTETTSGNNIYDPINVKYKYFKTMLPVYFENDISVISLWYQDNGGFVFLNNNMLKKLMEEYYYE